MEKVTILNPKNDVFTFSLYHSVYCANGAPCACTKSTVLRAVDGGLKYQEITSAVGVYLEGGTSQEFHSAVLQIQPVAAALAVGRLKQVKVETEAAKNQED